MSEEFNVENDPELQKMINDARNNGITLTDAYIQNLKDSKDQSDIYKASYPEALKIYNNIANSITKQEAEIIVDILKTNDTDKIQMLIDGLIDLYS